MVKIFKALSDETRLNILILVSKRNICQKGISKYLGISDSAVSQHIKILKDVGIITGYKEGYYVLYHINKESFNICVDFINSMLSNSSESFIDVFDVNTIHLGCSKECKSIKKCCKRREK
ncbi:bacterial regulatory, arsR family protein [Clostridioides difficile P20]|nr:bacterial regulatory, arsR family protein [Clostridioides difficile CD42]EQJ37412.1 bacterial regulatory, arsR family protein [Clostridioides difficile P20]EQJ72832.1 bacterial regulatory, arsR family protein [Clostridioides difficile P36]EQK19775.1 bacterial regulatory, arsR family protein [Clostridioides difficile P72]